MDMQDYLNSVPGVDATQLTAGANPTRKQETKKPGRRALRKNGRNVTLYLGETEVQLLRLIGSRQGGGMGDAVRFLLEFYATHR